MFCTCKGLWMGWKGLGIPSDEHVCKCEILCSSLEFVFLGIFCWFFLLHSELFFIISKSNCVRWLHGIKCEYRVEKKQESRAGEQMIRDCSGTCAELAPGRLRRCLGCSGKYSEDAQEGQEMLGMLRGCSGCSKVAQEDAQGLLRGCLGGCSEDAQKAQGMLRGCSGNAQRVLRGCSAPQVLLPQEAQALLSRSLGCCTDF